MTHVLIAGATGKTGRLLAAEILEKGHTPIALVRDSSDTSVLPVGTKTRVADLTDLPADVCAEADVVVFAAGSGGSTGPEMTDKVDRDGAIALIDAARRAGVERFVMLSSYGADQSDPSGDLAHYLKAKHDADEHLKASGVTYAILRPIALTDDAKTGDIRLGEGVDPSGEARRADVAAVLADAALKGRLDGNVAEMQTN